MVNAVCYSRTPRGWVPCMTRGYKGKRQGLQEAEAVGVGGKRGHYPLLWLPREETGSAM